MLITLPEFAKEVGISTRTVYLMIKNKELVPYQKRNKRNYFHIDQVKQFVGAIPDSDCRKIVAYARVSSSSQKEDLENQTKLLESFCTGQGKIVNEYIEEIGSGINFKRPKFLKLISEILNREVSEVIILTCNAALSA